MGCCQGGRVHSIVTQVSYRHVVDPHAADCSAVVAEVVLDGRVGHLEHKAKGKTLSTNGRAAARMGERGRGRWAN